MTAPMPPTTDRDALHLRLLHHGAASLSDRELLSLLVPPEAAESLLKHADHDLHNLHKQDMHDLLLLHNLTPLRAARLVAAMELGRRRGAQPVPQRTHVTTSAVAHELLRPVLTDLSYEEFWLLLMDRGNRLIKRLRVSQGGLHGTVADPKLIMRLALLHKASGIVLAHNHPSGQLRPSEEDIRLTRKLVEAAKFLDLTVQDHLICAQAGYYSFADNGQM